MNDPALRRPGKFAVTSIAGQPIEWWWVRGLQDKGDTGGRWIPEQDRIELDMDLTPVQAQEHAIHEAIHACETFAGFKVRHRTVRLLGLLLREAVAPVLITTRRARRKRT